MGYIGSFIVANLFFATAYAGDSFYKAEMYAWCRSANSHAGLFPPKADQCSELFSVGSVNLKKHNETTEWLIKQNALLEEKTIQGGSFSLPANMQDKKFELHAQTNAKDEWKMKVSSLGKDGQPLTCEKSVAPKSGEIVVVDIMNATGIVKSLYPTKKLNADGACHLVVYFVRR